MGNKDVEDIYTRGVQKATIWVALGVTFSAIIGSYYVHNYKTDENEKRISDIEMRVRTLEKMNPDLLIQQLRNIEEMNNQLDRKITSTNQRVDEVLRILISK